MIERKMETAKTTGQVRRKVKEMEQQGWLLTDHQIKAGGLMTTGTKHYLHFERGTEEALAPDLDEAVAMLVKAGYTVIPPTAGTSEGSV